MPSEPFLEEILERAKEDPKDKEKPDQQLYEYASVAIKQARKFQYLINRQENMVKKQQIEKKQRTIDQQQKEVDELKDQLNVLQRSIADRKNTEENIKEHIAQKKQDAKVILSQKNDQLLALRREIEENKK